MSPESFRECKTKYKNEQYKELFPYIPKEQYDFPSPSSFYSELGILACLSLF